MSFLMDSVREFYAVQHRKFLFPNSTHYPVKCLKKNTGGNQNSHLPVAKASFGTNPLNMLILKQN